jgi:hypothetical protein
MSLKNVAAGLVKKYKLVHLLELNNRQFYNERFEIVFYKDITFGQEFVAVVEVA